MVKIVDYGTDIIDISTAILDHRRGLNSDQVKVVEQIRQGSVNFVTSCFQHETADLITLYNFLSSQALQFVNIIVNHSGFLIRDRKLHPTYREAIDQITQSGHAILEELKQMKDELVTFMEKIGLQVSGLQSARSKNTRKQLQADLAFQADYLEDEPLPLPPLPAPEKRIKHLQPKPIQTKRKNLQHELIPITSKTKIRRLQPRPD